MEHDLLASAPTAWVQPPASWVIVSLDHSPATVARLGSLLVDDVGGTKVLGAKDSAFVPAR